VRLGIAPTIPLHCSDELTRACVWPAAEHGRLLQSHVAESMVQSVAALQRWGKSLTAHFEELGMLGPNFTVAHGVWRGDDVQLGEGYSIAPLSRLCAARDHSHWAAPGAALGAERIRPLT
jgi:hypothetical protein